LPRIYLSNTVQSLADTRSHVVRELLRAGFKVRGTVRSASKGDYLKDLFKDEGEFEYAIVADMGKVSGRLPDLIFPLELRVQEGAFDEVVKGVDAVVHTASPFHFKVTHPNELIEPAINGTVGVLRSIKKNKYVPPHLSPSVTRTDFSPGVKRVVVTSSCAAVQQIDSVKPPHVHVPRNPAEDS
jgi:nucleoside-diphosphate-sugar epimerase